VRFAEVLVDFLESTPAAQLTHEQFAAQLTAAS
jgi:hypothetical protein